MPWTKENYPVSLKNLKPVVRDKAIEIANALKRKEKYSDQRAIAIATEQAENWYTNDHPKESPYKSKK